MPRILAIIFALAASSVGLVEPATAQPTYSWTGCYIGANAGGAWTSWNRSGFFNWASGDEDGRSGSDTRTATGFIVGATGGCNYQFNPNWVFGAEVDWNSLLGAKTSQFAGRFDNQEPQNFAQFESNWLATIRGRLGFVATNGVLVFVTGGIAGGNVHYLIGRSTDPDPDYPSSATRWGWVAGLGFEYMLAPNWTVKVEYLHVDLGSVRLDPVGWNGSYTYYIDAVTRHDIVRVGFNFRFGS